MSPRAAMCAICDHVIHPGRLAAATRAADRRPSRAMRAPGGLRRAAMRVVLVLAALVVVGGVATVVLVRSLVREANELAARRADQQARTIARLRTAWPAIDAAAGRASRDVKVAGADARQPLRELLAALAPGAASPVRRGWFATMDADTAAWSRYGAPRLSTLPSGNRPARVVRASLPARLPDSVRVQLAADTTSPWIGVLRRAAAAPMPAAAWAYRPDVPGVSGPLTAPQFGLGALRALMWGNGASALLALDRGDRPRAVRHARENVAIAHLLARTPTTMTWFAGRQQLRESAALLAHVGRLASDSVAAADADALVRALDQTSGLRYAFGPMPGARDPGAPSLVALARDTLLPPAMRTETAVQIVTGSCLTVQESLAGVSDARRASLDAAVAGLADLDPDGRLRPMIARTLVEWRDMTDDGAAMLGGWAQRPAWGDALTAVGLGGVAGRTVGCTLL